MQVALSAAEASAGKSLFPAHYAGRTSGTAAAIHSAFDSACHGKEQTNGTEITACENILRFQQEDNS
jgi:hypothetical protein